MRRPIQIYMFYDTNHTHSAPSITYLKCRLSSFNCTECNWNVEQMAMPPVYSQSTVLKKAWNPFSLVKTTTVSTLKIISRSSIETQSISSSPLYHSLENRVFCSACGHPSSLNIRYFGLLCLFCPWWGDFFCPNDSTIYISALPSLFVNLYIFWFTVLLHIASHFMKILHKNKENQYFLL